MKFCSWPSVHCHQGEVNYVLKGDECLSADSKPVLCLSVTGALCLLALPRLNTLSRCAMCCSCSSGKKSRVYGLTFNT